MRHARNNSRSSSPRTNTGSKVALNERLTNFKFASKLGDKAEAARALLDFGGVYSLQLGAAALLETACLYAKPNTTSQTDLFVEAGIAATKVIKTAKVTGRTCISAVRADELIRDIPLLFPIYSEGVMPNLETIQAHYHKTIEAAGEVLKLRNKAKSSGDTTTKNDMNGHLGKTTIRLLLQRYGINEIGDNSYLPMSSHLTEERGMKSRIVPDISPSWNISIFTQCRPDGQIDMPYKIKAKAGVTPENIIYDNDITVVTPDQLAIPNEFEPSFLRVLAEIFAEERGELIGRNGDRPAGPRIDTRTQQLTTLIG